MEIKSAIIYIILIFPYIPTYYIVGRYLKQYIQTALNYSAVALVTSISLYIYNGIIFIFKGIVDGQAGNTVSIIAYWALWVCSMAIPIIFVLALILLNRFWLRRKNRC